MIPTTISFENNEHFKIVQYEFMSLKHDTVFLDQDPGSVISGTFEVSGFLKLPSGNPAGTPSLKGGL